MKLKKHCRLLSLLSIILLLCGILFTGTGIAEAADNKYSGGNGTKENPWRISTVEDLMFMRADKERDGSYGVHTHYFELTNDIVFNEDYLNYKKWGKKAPANKLDNPVDSYGEHYSFGCAYLEGNGHTIYGLYSEDNSLFYATYKTTIKNLNVSNFYMKNTPLIASGITDATYENINVDKGIVVFDENRKIGDYDWHANGGVFNTISSTPDNSSVVKNMKVNIQMTSVNENYVGMIAATGGKFENCTTNGKLTVSVSKKNSNGGYSVIVGGMAGSGIGSWKNCTNKANITVEFPATKLVTGNIGGLVGVMTPMTGSDGSKYDIPSMTECTNEGNITVKTKYNAKIAKKQEGLRQYDYVAGIVSSMKEGKMTTCTNKGKIKASYSEYVAGIVNWADDDMNISNCLNDGDITTVACGGTAGICNKFQGTLTHCENRGDLTSTEKLLNKMDFFAASYVSGIVGSVSSENKNSTINYCKNSGNIVSVDESLWTTSSGIADSLSQCEKKKYKCTVSNCYNVGTIEGSEPCGIVGHSGTYKSYHYKGHNYIKNCVNAGKLKSNYEEDRISGIIFMACYTDISNCYNMGTIQRTNSNYRNDRTSQLIGLCNEGSYVNKCYILTSKENKWPGAAINQNGGKTGKVTLMSKTKMKKLSSVKKIIKNAGVN